MIRNVHPWPIPPQERRNDWYTIVMEAGIDKRGFPPTTSGYHCIQSPQNELGLTLNRIANLGATSCAVLIPEEATADMGCYVQTHEDFSLMMGWNYGCMCLYAPEGDPLAEDFEGLIAMARHYNDLLREEVIEPWWELSEYRESVETLKEKGGKHDTGS